MDSDTVTWIGTGVSIAGGLLSLWQAGNARSAAEKAERARKEISGRYDHRELSALDADVAAALRAMEKYGPGARPSSIRGASFDNDANVVRLFTAALDRHAEMLSKAFAGPCDDVRDRINAWLNEFGAAPTAADRLEKGKSIYLEIATFSGNMKKALDTGTFKLAESEK